MMSRGFKPVGWVAGIGGAALGCYLLSLNVAAERAELAGVDRQIIAAARTIDALETEIGTRGRLSQLDRWNVEVLALAAPAPQQFVKDELTLARFDRREAQIGDQADIRLASADTAPATPKAAQPALRMAAADYAAVGARNKLSPAAPVARPLVQRAAFVPAGAKPFTAAKAVEPAIRKAGLLDDRLVAEIGRTSRFEKGAGGTGTQ